MKRCKLIAALLLVLLTVAFVCISCSPAKVNEPEVTVKVNGKEVKADGTVYAISFANDVTRAVVEATTTVGEIKGAGTFDLKEGENVFTLTLIANGKETALTVKVTRAAAEKPADTTLAEVKAGDEVLRVADGKYTATVDYETDKVNLTAAASDSNATVEGTGEKSLNVGVNTFEIKVTCGKDSTVYTVEITRKAPVLTLAEVKVGDTVLTADGKDYIINVANDTESVEISAAADNAAAVVAGTGVKEGLAVGENRFALTVTVDGITETYNVIVNRAGSSVKTITKVTVNGVDAVCDAENGTYTVTVTKTTADVNVILSSAVSSYAFDEEIGTLTEGTHEYVITVTAEDGSTAAYTLVLHVELPVYSVTYTGNIDGAVINETYTYKYGVAQNINILLGAAYNKSYAAITVTYTVAGGESRTVTLDADHAFTVPAEEAVGDIVVTVEGVALNTYTVTYHKDGVVTAETVEHGAAAQNADIIPDTSTKEVLDGYTYAHIESWMTEEDGMVKADLSAVTSDMDVYYKHEIIVRSEVDYYAPMTGAVTYYTIRQMNGYVAGDENGDVVFKVLIKSRAIDGQSESEGKTSFVIYGTAVWNEANELGISLTESELNQWFTVKASAADKKVTVYRPDGSVAGEKVMAEYAADTISLAMHANVAVAAVDPVVPEICTVTYLDENGETLNTEKVFKGQAAGYAYARSSEDMGDGYAKEYRNIRWLNADGEDVDLSAVSADVTVRLGFDIYVTRNAAPRADTALTALNEFISADENGIISFRLRVNNTGWASIAIVATGGWANISGGVVAGDTWYIVSIDTNTGAITIVTEDGVTKDLDESGYNACATSLGAVMIKITDGDFDIAAVNPVIPDVCTVTYLDENGDVLSSETVFKGHAAKYAYTKPSADLGGGYLRAYTGKWVNADGTDADLSAVSSDMTVKYSVTEVTVQINVAKFDDSVYGYKSVMGLNKYVQPDDNGILRFRIRANGASGFAFTVYEYTNWYDGVIGAGQWVDVGDLGNKWYLIEIDTGTGEVKIDGELKATFTRKVAREFGLVIGGTDTSVDIAAVNPPERKPFGTNVGEVFLESAADQDTAVPDLYEKVMKRTSFNCETFTTVDLSAYTEVRFMTYYPKGKGDGWYLFNGWTDGYFQSTEWIEWQLVKTGDTWTLNIYSDSKTYKTAEGLTGSTLQEIFSTAFPNMKSNGIGNAEDYIWTTELRAK